jgi:phospholipase/lecithinase/hemolysin
MNARTGLVIGSALFALIGYAHPISQVVSFGDSLSDNGNLFALTGYPGAPYWQGRFSNGPVWVEYLSSDLGKTLNDYAYGGADTDTVNTLAPGTGIRWQVDSYLAAHPSVDSDALYVLNGGTNDYIDGASDPTVPVNNFLGEIHDLAQHGGGLFLIMSLPDLGITPALYGTALQDLATQLSIQHNALIQSGLADMGSQFPTVHFIYFDVFAIQHQIFDDPGAYGFTNVTDSYLDKGSGDPYNYAYWDIGHPTTHAHHIIGDAAYTLVPEPCIAVSFAALVAAAVRRRQRQGLRRA